MANPDAFRRTPKIELHLHVAGSVRPTTIGEWVAADGLPASLIEEYRPAQAREGLPRFLARFGAWDATVRTPERMSQVVQELCDDLAADGVPRPLGQSFTLASIWFDLATIAGEEVPPDVVALLDAPPDLAAVAAD